MSVTLIGVSDMSDLPKADMRGVKFDFTSGIYSRRVGDLCERCGQYSTCNKSSKRASVEFDVEVVTSECETFQPIVLFVNPKGTDKKFSTLRVGKAWQTRVRAGSIVALMNKKNEVYNRAMITSVRTMPKAHAIEESTMTNHMMLDYDGNDGDRFSRLSKIVSSAYGKMIWDNNDLASVLSMKVV